jgi:hypothetical protein
MYFVVDPDTEVAPQHAALVWQRLWELRDLAPIGAVMPAVVSSPCPLLPNEVANATLVATLTQVPSGTAWVSVDIDLMRYARADGSLQLAALESALRSAVELGERRHVETRWRDAEQSEDSRINRRLAVFVRGWGDLVRARAMDPRAIAALRHVEGLADHVGGILEDASRKAAAQHGHCPALDVAGAQVLHHGGEMNERWRRAVTDNALRHRNLLTLSPWDVFPRGEPADFSWMNLLPIIRKANSVSLQRGVDISFWSAGDFRAFHERVCAILRTASDTPLLAQQV